MAAAWRRMGVALALALLGAGLRPAAADTPIMPLDEVRIGMHGVGRTVFQGTEIEPFDCTVIGLLEGFDFEMDMILIRITSSPVVTQKWGVISGMSGSPIYIDGKMIGALAYGWEFQNEPVAGVTPIEQMLWQYDPDHPEARAAKVRRERREATRDQRLQKANEQLKMQGAMRPVDGPLSIDGQRFAEVHLAENDLDAARLHRQRPDVGILAPVSTPVFCKGLGGTGMRMMERLLEPYNLVPMQSGAMAPPPDVEASFEPGAAIAVPITTGDIEMTAVGTLTYLDGDIALGFGHPFFGFGKVEMPMATGYIHGVISSAASSFKLGSMLKPVGAITQDRPTCIGGTMGRLADTLPVQYTLHEAGRGGRDFSIRLIRQPNMTDLYTVILMQMAMQNFAGGYFDGVTSSAVTIETRIPENGRNLVIKRSNSFDSKAASDFGGNPLWDLFMTLSLLRSNPFGEADVAAVKVDLRFEGATRLANIERAQAEQQTVKRGERFDVEVFLKPYGGETTSMSIPVQVPENAPLGPLVVLLVGGNDAAAIRPRINPPPYPDDVPSLIHWLNDTVPNDSLVVEKVLPTFGLEMSGHQLHDIPAPIVEPLFTSTVDDMRLIPDVDENVIPTADVVAGVAAVMVEVIGDEGQRAEGSAGNLGDIPRGPMMAPDMGMMSGMMNAAARTMASLVGDMRPTPELAWTLRPPSLASADPALQRLDRIVAALGGARSSTPPRARRASQVVWNAARPAPSRRQSGDVASRQASDDSTASETGTPDVTDGLKLGEPPQMPTWKELEELAGGKMTTGEADAGADEGEGGDEETDEDKPLARPVSTWSLSTVEDFVAGRFDGSYPSGDGAVHLAPLTRVVGKPSAERTWSVLPLKDGTVLAGSWGPEATIFKLGADQTASEYFKTDEAGLVALAQLSDGAVVAGGIPSGKIYKVTAAGKGTVLADLEEEYIWSLEPDAKGGVYAATGRNGRLYHVDGKGQATVVMQSSDRHVIDLAPAPAGGVYAATYPLGKVYKVVGDQVESVFQSSNGAVLALAATDNGNIYVGTADSGSIYKVSPDGMVSSVAEVEDSHIYAMVSVGNTVYAATSGPGQLVRIDDEDTKALVYRTDEPYLLALAAVDGKKLLTTVAGSGEVVQLELQAGQQGEYLSPVHDAEMRAHWGVARWDQAVEGQARIAIQTRTGNTAQPDKAWSDWSPWLTNAAGEPIASPAARYIQFRAVLYAQPGETCRLDRVTVFFRTLNRPPKLVLETPAAGTVANKSLEISWEAEDPDEDDLHYEVFYAPVGSDEWTLIEAASDEAETGDEGDEGGEGDDGTTTDDTGTDDATPSDDAADTGDAAAAAFQPFGQRQTPVSHLRRFLDALPLQGDRPPRGPKVGEDKKPNDLVDKAEAAEAEAAEDGEDTSDQAATPEKLTESSIEWDTTKVPDGLYRVKVVAHDEVRNPDDPKVVTVISKPVRVDNTGPVLSKPETVEGRPPAELVFSEEGTYLSSAEYRIDDGEWRALLPNDGLFDSPTETLKTPALPAEAGEHTVTIRVRDAVGNLSKFQWTFTVEG